MYQDFDAAVSDYTEFLKKCGCPSRIIWVTPEDVLFTRSGRIYIRHAAEGRAAQARKQYEAGLESGLGVEFLMLCELNDSARCFVWFPRDRGEAERMMMPADGSLKMSALNNSSKRKGKGIRSRLAWEVLRRRYEKNGELYGYPFGNSRGFVARVSS